MSSVILQPNLNLKHFYTATLQTFESKYCSLFDPENFFSVKYHQRMAQGSSCPLCHFCASVYINSFQCYKWMFPDGCTYCLILHACKDDVEHLCERGLGCGLVDEVLAGQVDVVTRADGLQDGALMDFYVLGGHCCQQSLAERVNRGRERGGECLSGSFRQLFVTLNTCMFY